MEINKIYNESCLDTIKRMPNNFIHSVITSPPYYAGKEYEDMSISYEEYIRFLLEVFTKLYDRIVPGGHLWINIDDKHTSLKSEHKKSVVLPTHAILTSELYKIYDYKEMVLWKKIRSKHASGGARVLLGSFGRFGSPGSIPIVQEVEYILWFKKPGVRKDVTDEMRKQSSLTREEFNTYGMQIWEIKPESAKKIGHPAPYPIELVSRIIKLSTFVGDVVYDPFAGSGTTAVACKLLGRNYIGSEISDKYCKIAEERIKNSNLI